MSGAFAQENLPLALGFLYLGRSVGVAPKDCLYCRKPWKEESPQQMHQHSKNASLWHGGTLMFFVLPFLLELVAFSLVMIQVLNFSPPLSLSHSDSIKLISFL